MNQITPAGQRRVPAAFASLRPEDNTISEGIGGGFATIGYRGSKWSLIRGGDETYLQVFALDCIILDAPTHKSKTFYPLYEEGSRKPPACSSIDGIVPDPGVPAPQARQCALCPQNERKAGDDGKLRSACRDAKRVAILVCPSTFTNPDGTTLDEPVMLRVPAGSLTDLDKYNKMLQKNGYTHPCMVITSITFDPKASYPKFIFTMKMAIESMEQGSDETAAYVMDMRGDDAIKRITGADQLGRRPLLIAQGETAQMRQLTQQAPHSMDTGNVAVNPATGHVQEIIPPQQAAPKAPAPIFGQKKPPAAPALATAGTPTPPPNGGAQAQVQQPSIGQAASDVGEGESADDETNAAINAALTM